MKKCNAVLNNALDRSANEKENKPTRSRSSDKETSKSRARPRSLGRFDSQEDEDRLRRSSLYLFRNSAYRRDLFNVTDFDIINSIGVGTFGDVFLCSLSERSSFYQEATPEFKSAVFALKVMPIRHVIQENQVAHVKNERKILACVDHPFIVRLFWSGHSPTHLFLLMEFVPGGELFSYMKKAMYFKPQIAAFYAAEIVSVLDYLHAICMFFV